MTNSSGNMQHVVAAVIPRHRSNSSSVTDLGLGQDTEVLLSLRHQRAHQGGLWEFPGGKVEHAENPDQALVRELDEELGITMHNARPLIQIHHNYHDKSVLLDVWLVETFSGEAHGREGQEIAWIAIDNLRQRKFPAANHAIVNAVSLPDQYFITPDPDKYRTVFLDIVERALSNGIRLIQFRAKQFGLEANQALVKQVLELCHAHKAQLLLNNVPEEAMAIAADGVHLSSDRLMALERRPLPDNKWVAASCHNAAELGHACGIGVDFAVLSPVMPTDSHPDAETLGWHGFRALARQATVPVYALGGMTVSHLDRVYQHGGQGIAAISSIWEAASRSL